MADELEEMKRRRKSLSGARKYKDPKTAKKDAFHTGLAWESMGSMLAPVASGMLKKIPVLKGAKVKLPWNKRKKKNGPS